MVERAVKSFPSSFLSFLFPSSQQPQYAPEQDKGQEENRYPSPPVRDRPQDPRVDIDGHQRKSDDPDRVFHDSDRDNGQGQERFSPVLIDSPGAREKTDKEQGDALPD